MNRGNSFIILAAVLIALTGCRDSSVPQAGHTQEESGLSDAAREQQESDLDRQMLLYLQKGLQEYEIGGDITVYISPWEEDGRWSAYLDDGTNFWEETQHYQFDSEKNWYEILSGYEPLLTGDPIQSSYFDDKEKEEIRKNSVFRTVISADSVLPWASRYTAPPGPVILDQRKYKGHFEDLGLESWLYVMEDKRKGASIVIEYPQISPYADGMTEKLAKKINDKIRSAFFYGYLEEENLDPLHEINGGIERYYQVTRQDEDFISMRIYEFNYHMRANHPNEWEQGFTVDLKTGEAVALEDLIRGDLYQHELLETGAFHGLWVWRDGAGQEDDELEQDWIRTLIADSREEESEGKDRPAVKDIGNRYYLTSDGLGIITSQGRYYVCLEAEFEDLIKKIPDLMK